MLRSSSRDVDHACCVLSCFAVRAGIVRSCVPCYLCLTSQMLNSTGFSVSSSQARGVASRRTTDELYILTENLPGSCTGRRAWKLSCLAHDDSTPRSDRDANRNTCYSPTAQPVQGVVRTRHRPEWHKLKPYLPSFSALFSFPTAACSSSRTPWADASSPAVLPGWAETDSPATSGASPPASPATTTAPRPRN